MGAICLDEAAIPELVKRGNLCPHQDFVMLNYPKKPLETFRLKVKALIEGDLFDSSLTH